VEALGKQVEDESGRVETEGHAPLHVELTFGTQATIVPEMLRGSYERHP